MEDCRRKNRLSPDNQTVVYSSSIQTIEIIKRYRVFVKVLNRIFIRPNK